jgi:spore coat protein U-like protein
VKAGFALAALILLGCSAQQAAAQLGCSVSAAAMNFGTYTGTVLTPGATPITVGCPILAAYTVGLNAGLGLGATTTTRKMTGPGSATLSYQLFQNSSLTTNWGNTVNTNTESGTGSGFPQTLEIYPEAASGQNVPPGTYTDTITISVIDLLGTGTTTMLVTATVQASCLASASALSFGIYSGLTIPMTSAITVTCTTTTTFNIGLSAGTATGATVTTRKMTGPSSHLLSYALFRNSGHTLNWGNTVGTDTLASTGSGVATMYTVYGQVAGAQYVTPGQYTDTVIATITY